MRSLALGLLLLALSTAPALAQSATDPVGTVSAFYVKNEIHSPEFYSKKLNRLLTRDEQKAKKTGGSPNLDFAFQLNGQDAEEGWRKTLRLELVSREGKHAEVKALFKNFQPQDLRYSLVLESGHWVIDDVRSTGPDAWQLSKLLTRP